MILTSKVKANAKLLENTRLVTENTRGHSVICDLPVASGGDNSGPTPLELSLMSLAGCGVIIFADICKNSKIELGKVEIGVEAEKSSGSPKLTGVTMKVNVSSKVRKELLEAAWRRTEETCPVLLIFKEPVPVKVEFEAKQE